MRPLERTNEELKEEEKRKTFYFSNYSPTPDFSSGISPANAN